MYKPNAYEIMHMIKELILKDCGDEIGVVTSEEINPSNAAQDGTYLKLIINGREFKIDINEIK